MKNWLSHWLWGAPQVFLCLWALFFLFLSTGFVSALETQAFTFETLFAAFAATVFQSFGWSISITALFWVVIIGCVRAVIAFLCEPAEYNQWT